MYVRNWTKKKPFLISLHFFKVIVHNYCTLQYNLFFKTQKTAYEPLKNSNHKLGYKVKEKDILRTISFFGISENFLWKILNFHYN